MEREHLLELRVGLRIRFAGQARGDERYGGREVHEGHIHSANAEGATAAVMRYGYQRGEHFEGCEKALSGRHVMASIFGWRSNGSEIQ
jgi:hypothetical protein